MRRRSRAERLSCRSRAQSRARARGKARPPARASRGRSRRTSPPSPPRAARESAPGAEARARRVDEHVDAAREGLRRRAPGCGEESCAEARPERPTTPGLEWEPPLDPTPTAEKGSPRADLRPVRRACPPPAPCPARATPSLRATPPCLARVDGRPPGARTRAAVRALPLVMDAKTSRRKVTSRLGISEVR